MTHAGQTSKDILDMANDKLDPKLEDWVIARKRHHLSHAHVQMARELGMSPKKLGGKDNHKQEPWKAPLPDFIQTLYEKRFGREWPTDVKSIEEIAKAKSQKKAIRKAAKAERKKTVAEGVKATNTSDEQGLSIPE